MYQSSVIPAWSRASLLKGGFKAPLKYFGTSSKNVCLASMVSFSHRYLNHLRPAVTCVISSYVTCQIKLVTTFLLLGSLLTSLQTVYLQRIENEQWSLE